MKQKCIYLITCTANNTRYVGSSSDLETRWKTHKWLLSNNKHHSKIFQNTWNKYGESQFVLEVLEDLKNANKEELLNKEQYYIDLLKPQLNICIKADSCLGVKRSEEFCLNKSQMQIGEKNHFYGKKHSEETKNKMREKSLGRKLDKETKDKIAKSRKNKYKGVNNPYSKFTEDQIRQIRKMREDGKLMREIGEIFNSPRQIISNIINRKTYSDIE
jgi:group I intron endonuclease